MSGKKQLDNSMRETIIKKYNNGEGNKSIAESLQLKVSTVQNIINIYKEEGRVEAKQSRTPREKKIMVEAETKTNEYIEANISITLAKIKEKFNLDLNIDVSSTSINNVLQKMKYSLKRISYTPEARNTEVVIERRAIYCSDFMLKEESKFIFVDEFGVSCCSRLSYGRSHIGSPARKTVRAIRFENYSVCAAVTKDEPKFFETKPTAFNLDSFYMFITDLINSNFTNGCIVLDNASIHKSERLKTLVESLNFSLMFLPPYTPQPSFIEKVFSKCKHYIKVSNPETVPALEASIMSSSLQITTSDCNAFFNHMKTFILRGIRRENFG